MNKNILSVIFISLVALWLNGCATLFGDNTRQVTVKSNPAGADIYIDGIQYGTTPSVITLPNYIYGGKVITLEKKGYNTQSKVVGATFQPVGLWNILFPIGFIIDAVSGDIVKVEPHDLTIYTDLSKQ